MSKKKKIIHLLVCLLTVITYDIFIPPNLATSIIFHCLLFLGCIYYGVKIVDNTNNEGFNAGEQYAQLKKYGNLAGGGALVALGLYIGFMMGEDVFAPGGYITSACLVKNNYNNLHGPWMVQRVKLVELGTNNTIRCTYWCRMDYLSPDRLYCITYGPRSQIIYTVKQIKSPIKQEP